MVMTIKNVLQIKYLNSGSFGLVELALDRRSGELVAIKFIPRGDKVMATLGLIYDLLCVLWMAKVLALQQDLPVQPKMQKIS